MKKVLAIAVLGVFALSSCKKDYTCSCSSAGYSFDELYSDIKKKDAEDKCDKKQADIQTVNSSVTCSLK